MGALGTKPYLRTGQVAKLLGISTRTVCAWVDNGRIKGWRVPKGAGDEAVTECEGADRRIDPASFVAFLRHHEIPVPTDLRRWDGAALVVTVACNGLAARLRDALPPWWAVAECPDAFTLGRTHCPALCGAVVVDFPGMGTPEALSLGRALLRDGRPRRLVAVLPEGGVTLAPAEYGYTDCLEHPVDPARLAALVSE